MRFVSTERAVLDALLPRLDATLAASPPVDLERLGSPGTKLFKESDGAGPMVPPEYGGKGADALTAARVQRAVRSLAAGLAGSHAPHRPRLCPHELDRKDPSTSQPVKHRLAAPGRTPPCPQHDTPSTNACALTGGVPG